MGQLPYLRVLSSKIRGGVACCDVFEDGNVPEVTGGWGLAVGFSDEGPAFNVFISSIDLACGAAVILPVGSDILVRRSLGAYFIGVVTWAYCW